MYLPSDNSSTTLSPKFLVTFDDISPTPERLEVEQITGHLIVRGRGGVVTVLCETHWVGLHSPSRERDLDLQQSRSHMVLLSSGTPTQHRQANHPYYQMRIGVALRELSLSIAQIFFASGYNLVPHNLWLRLFSSNVLPLGAHHWYEARDGRWLLGKIANRVPLDSPSGNHLHHPGPRRP